MVEFAQLKTVVWLLATFLLGTTAVVAQPISPMASLAHVREMKQALPGLMAQAKAAIHRMIPDPDGYRSKLPSYDDVVLTGDKVSFKKWGGLAEAYLYGGDKASGMQIFEPFQADAQRVLGPDDNFPALIAGDFGTFLYSEGDYEHAEPLLLTSIAHLEHHPNPAIINNLISDYFCITLIRDSQQRTAEAAGYAKRLVDLSPSHK